MSEPDLANAGTLPPDDTVPSAGSPPAGTVPSAGSLPVGHWDRYELLDVLGKGGMGVVYRARDRRLERTVAIKFILGADPALTMRFLREARAQARIDHPNICRVYEVGEVQGRAYIALQLVDGEPLHVAGARMSLDERVAVLRDVAAAIQEAHRLGIVHRDLKPANVVVERTEDGRWLPVVMDFGLAREITVGPGLTESGMPLGTPAYMSPEQARGDVRAVDRRSDVYSLGATAYELWTGRPPFNEPSLAQALAQVIHGDPPAPRSLVPGLPVDLETITLQCLAKDPAQRYPSARALADDLGRYLAGEPILGQRPSLWQRVRHRARRHRALVVLGLWSLAIIAVVAALGVRAWLTSRAERAQAAARTRLAERLAREAKDIELFLRTAYQLPLHDTRPERAVIRSRMRAIAETHHELGELGDAVIHDALGRGHLALHEWREAADELARAAEAGLRTPELHAARGRALGELYHRALEEARRSGGGAWLEQRQQALAQQYLTPALAELQASRGSGEDAALLEALIAQYRGEFAAAERGARAVAGRAPWLVEARRLAADAAYGAGLDAVDHGRYDEARPALDRAGALYAEASDASRSDASVYEAAAQSWLERAEIDYRQGRLPDEPIHGALEAVDRALLADPEDAAAYTTQAFVLLRWFRTPSLRPTGDQRPLLERMAEAAARATAIDPRDPTAWDALGNAHVYRGIYEDAHGGDGVVWLNRALGEFDRALAVQPGDPWANNDRAIAHRWLGDALEKTGRDPMPEYQAALRGYERAVEVDPQYVFAWTNQADLHATIAEYDAARGIDPRPAVDRALRAGERALAIDPNLYSLLGTMAQAELALAQYLVDTGGDPGEPIAKARGHLDRAMAVQPGNMVTWFLRGVAAELEAKLRLRDGGDPAAAIAAAQAALDEAVRLVPDSAYAHVELARLGVLEASAGAQRGRGAAELLARARAHAEQAVALNAQLPEARLVAAEVALQIAAGQPSREVIDRGMAYIDQALALHPGLPRAQAVRAKLSQLRAP